MVIDEDVFIRELRIGNLVRTLDGQIKQVCLISLEIDDEYLPFVELVDIGKGYNATGDIIRNIIRNILPVPLSVEWLVKLGFKPETNRLPNRRYFSPILENHIDYDADRFIYVFYHEQVCEIRYVHQLQNLYFCITGEEIEVK